MLFSLVWERNSLHPQPVGITPAVRLVGTSPLPLSPQSVPLPPITRCTPGHITRVAFLQYFYSYVPFTYYIDLDFVIECLNGFVIAEKCLKVQRLQPAVVEVGRIAPGVVGAAHGGVEGLAGNMAQPWVQYALGGGAASGLGGGVGGAAAGGATGPLALTNSAAGGQGLPGGGAPGTALAVHGNYPSYQLGMMGSSTPALALFPSVSDRMLRNPLIAHRIQKGREIGRTPSRIVQLLNAVFESDLLVPSDCEDVKKSVFAEAVKFGKIEEIVVPRPDSKNNDGVGKIFIAYTDVTSARKFQAEINGRTFDGRVVCAAFYPTDRFKKGLYSLTTDA